MPTPQESRDAFIAAAQRGEAAGERWIHIERQYSQDLVIGAYVTEAAADLAMDEALLIDGFCEEDGLDCYVGGAPEPAEEIVIIDPSDRHHTGRPED